MASDPSPDRPSNVSSREVEAAARDAKKAAAAADGARGDAEAAARDAEEAADVAEAAIEAYEGDEPVPFSETPDRRGARDAEPDDEPDPVLENAPDGAEHSPVEEMARRQFGIRTWERPALYRETAEAATDTDVPFFAVLLLSGAIATLGLVLDSTAVVIGAMLVAPLLGPLLGLSLALAVGDGRLFAQTAAAVALGAAGIVALAALLTLAMPFQTVTDEILSRTRPTTLDLGIAVFSGLAGAVVTASREARLSASIPGVAVAVALVPPLGVAGFGIAIGEWAFTRGALLLFGANLAGIVLSGMGVFFLIGMHRSDVVEAARAWHAKGEATGVAARVSGMHWLDRLPGMATPLGRTVLVVAFMAAVSVPLTSSLGQFVREARLNAAVDAVEGEVERTGRAFVIERDLSMDEDAAGVRLRVATSSWIQDSTEAALAALLESQAGEPTTLTIEQVLASTGDLASFADALPTRSSPSAAAPPPPTPLPATLADVRTRLAGALDGLAVPDGVRIVAGEVQVETEGGPPHLEVTYAADRSVSEDAEALLARQAARTLGLDEASARAVGIRLGARAFPDSAGAAPLASLVAELPLRLTLAGDTAAVRSMRARLLRLGAPPGRVRARPDTSGLRAALALLPDSLRTR